MCLHKGRSKEFYLKILFYTKSTSKQLNITVQKRIVVMKENQPYKDNDKVWDKTRSKGGLCFCRCFPFTPLQVDVIWQEF